MFLWLLITAAAAQPTLPSFEFRGFHPGDSFVQGDTRFLVCKANGAGPACALKNDIVAGVKVHQVGVAYGHNGLYALEIMFDEKDSEVIEAALRSKYGRPCRETVEHPFNAFGVHFDRRVRVWCFKEGDATFKSMTDSASKGSFEFATKDAAAQKAVQDF
jgi:hypothetical protein